MSQADVLLVFREAIWMILKLAAPMLLVSMLLGLVISVFQAATQIHEQTITFVPKIFAIAFILIIAGSWMLTNLTDFFSSLMSLMAGL
ncbi:MAG: flagellar biosynthetic protein FliQ [Clostridium sp. SCN 57-10]|nr:MAG: flagellar biosynthetic protein FliQ [Clostridium sp. SCN 57-10]